MKVRKASRAQWDTALHADVFGLPSARSIMAFVCIFHLSELGPVISCAKPDLTGYFGDCSPLHGLWGPTGSSSLALLEAIYQCMSHRSFEEEESHLYQTRHQVEAPGIYNGHIEKNEKTLGCTTSCFDVCGGTLSDIGQQDQPHSCVDCKGHREGFLDHHHCFFLLDPSVGNIFMGLASTG